jgi:TolB-like protein/class 3 adenylate cyclase/Tfp pilus assembly protein PilF
MSAEVKKEIEPEIAHLLLIDLVGYSKLLVDDQIDVVEELNRIVRSTECFQTAEKNGKLIRVSTGDGIALLFSRSPEEPVQCALEISKALKNSPQIQVRMGVHSGPVSGVIDVNERANVAGSGINVAQRVMDCGDPGHILLSKHVAEDLEQYRQWQPYLHDLGECEVKHGVRITIVNLYTDEVGNPRLPKKFQAQKKHSARIRWAVIAAALLLLAVGSWYFGFFRPARPKVEAVTRISTATAIPEKSIAVLPFENRSEDKANAYFADGIQDEILTRLSKIADLKVISRTSTQHYKSAPENLPEIAKQLGVAHILEGSVQKSGGAVRVNVQLIKAADDSHLWAATFDRKLTDIFSVETDVAKAIADQLQAKLTGQEEQVIAAKPTDNVEAYDAYLRGLVYTLKTSATPANSLGGQKYLREAVRLDPKFALGWALLSYVNSVGYLSTTLQPTVALREEARQAVETALSLQPNLGEAVLAKGYYHYACLKDYGTAVRYFEEARQFLPNSSRIPESLAYVTRRQGQWDRSESYFNEAERLDPHDVGLLTQHAISYTALRRFPEALRKLEQVLNITPDDVDTLAQKAAIVQAEGDLPRAAALLDPLRPAADETNALETQVYQAILERRPAQIIPRLKETLANPDPALGYLNGELRFWLGWAQEVAGDHAAAQETWRQARNELESILKEQPENFVLIGDLALTSMGLRDRAAALALAERAIAANPIEKDAVFGPMSIEILARVAARMGEPDRAIAALENLLSIPYNGALAENVPLTPALLRFDPMFDLLRGDPRFEKIVASLAPKKGSP